MYAQRGMVATSQPLAAQAGIEILAMGGTAADAAVAAAAALNVTEPTSTGIGGDCFALYYEATTRNVTALNGSGRAPAGLTLERLASQELSGGPTPASDTVYLAIIDEEGNACSFINSNYMGFGTGIVPKGWGFTLQNRGHGFSLNPDHPNSLAPGKRPYHTIIPGLVTRPDGALSICFGVMGGFMQPQGHVQVLAALIDDGLDPQAALDRPRVCLTEATPASSVALEDGIPDESRRQLETMGHQVEVVRGQARALFGRGQVIRRDPETGVLCGGSDPRADGCALPLI